MKKEEREERREGGNLAEIIFYEVMWLIKLCYFS